MKTAIIRAAAAAFVSLLAGLSANAQSDAQWPTKPVRILVPTAAGGPTDYTARFLADELTTRLGQPFVIENRPGAGHQIGMTAVANAEPDGYTIGAVSTPYVFNPALYKKLPYDMKALKPVFLLTTSPLVLGVPSSLPAKSVQELVALAKAKPGELNMASPGNTTGPHLAGELFQSVSGVKLQHVPYRGGPTGDHGADPCRGASLFRYAHRHHASRGKQAGESACADLRDARCPAWRHADHGRSGIPR